MDAPRLWPEPALWGVGACRVPATHQGGEGSVLGETIPSVHGGREGSVFVLGLARRNTTRKVHFGTRIAEKMPEMVSAVSPTESGRGGEAERQAGHPGETSRVWVEGPSSFSRM